MKQYTPIKNVDNLEGKTILKSRSFFTDRLVIVFTDDTFLYIRAEPQSFDESDLDFNKELPAFELKTMGLITQEEYTDIQRKENEESRQHIEQKERQQYEYLKLKFENKENETIHNATAK